MDRTYIDRYIVVDRYLQGTLTDGEQAEFEERLVWDQALVEELELAEALRNGLRASGAEGKYVSGDEGSLGARLKSMMSMPRYAAAASFVMGVLLTSVLVSNRVPDVDPAAAGSGPTTVVPLLVLRSSNVQSIEIEPDGMTVLMIDVPPGYRSYRVSVRRGDASAPFWRQEGLVPGYLDQLAVGVPGRELMPARYLLTLEGVADQAEPFVQEIPFETIIAE